MQVPSCQVPSAEASKTILRRSHQLAKVREIISGGTSMVQLQSEIRCLSKEERQEILKDANLNSHHDPPQSSACKEGRPCIALGKIKGRFQV